MGDNYMYMAMSKRYNKDYSKKTADEWFKERVWTGFLKTIPPGRTVKKRLDSTRDLLSLRAIAGSLSSASSSCKYKFSVTTDVEDESIIYVTATKK